MTARVFKPNIKKILRDILILAGLIYLGVSLRSSFTMNVFILIAPFVIGIGAIYLFIMGFLPYLKITDSRELEYRSDYGITRKIKLTGIKKITKGSGLGGYEHALFVYHQSDSGQTKKMKIKSSYFNREDIIELMATLRKLIQVETNEELEAYLAGHKPKYSWKI